jgi:hypothetical protein
MCNDRKEEFSNKVFFGGIIGILMIFFILFCKNNSNCYNCTVTTTWPELKMTVDSTFKFCDKTQEWATEFEKHNTYVDSTLSTYKTIQICKCERK